MRLLPIAASVAFAVTPAWGAASPAHRHKTHKPEIFHSAVKTRQTNHSTPYSSASQHGGRPQASLRTVRFTRAEADPPQSDSSTNTASSNRKSRKKKRVTSHRKPSQMAPTPDRIDDIQSALARGGYYKGEPNGKMDADTVDALQRFQSANGLDTNGKLDALTLQKLGLGSEIAGVSSPKGITPHSCCSISPSPSLAPRPTASLSGSSTASAEVSKPATAPGASSPPSTDPPAAAGATSH